MRGTLDMRLGKAYVISAAREPRHGIAIYSSAALPTCQVHLEKIINIFLEVPCRQLPIETRI